MGKPARVFLALSLAAALFGAGAWYGRQSGVGASSGRKVLYYADPMHPSYQSDKPGIAPDCGMQLEPVYADGGPAGEAEGGGSLPVGTVRVQPTRQQAIGIRVTPVERSGGSRSVRVVGRVAPEENRVHRVVSPTEGWVRRLFEATTGSKVRKDQLLATFYTRDIVGGVQALFFALGTLDRYRAANAPQDQIIQANNQIRTAEANLMALGVGETQIREIERTRKFQPDIEIRSPVDGLVATRSVFPNLRFEKNAELYRIVDLSQVWILADAAEDEVRFFRAGSVARLTLPAAPGESLRARVSDVPPQFDPATRRFKVRLEANNRGYTLRPDMIVDVELSVPLPAGMVLPEEAVIDSGLRKTVFVDRGNGLFEPRRVETGWQWGDKVQITRGLMAGERIVVSGNFLLDSESRMRAQAAGIHGVAVECAVCGMPIEQAKANATGRVAPYRGRTYYFCSAECLGEFRESPERHASFSPPAAPGLGQPAHSLRGEIAPPPAPAPVPAALGTDAPAQRPMAPALYGSGDAAALSEGPEAFPGINAPEADVPLDKWGDRVRHGGEHGPE